MQWREVTKDTKFKTGDILKVKYQKTIELAFIDSATVYGEPTRISSIPESWSYSFEYDMLPKMKVNCSKDIDPTQDDFTISLGTTRLKNYTGKHIITILKYMRPKV